MRGHCDGHHETSDLGAAGEPVHSRDEGAVPGVAAQRRMVRAVWMETIMSKTNDTSNLATLEHHDPLADSELDAVTGGADAATAKLYEACCTGKHIPNVVIG